METTRVNDVYGIMYFSVYNMFIDNELEEIVFEGVVRSFSFYANHISIVTEFDLFCKSLAWWHDLDRFKTKNLFAIAS